MLRPRQEATEVLHSDEYIVEPIQANTPHESNLFSFAHLPQIQVN